MNSSLFGEVTIMPPKKPPPVARLRATTLSWLFSVNQLNPHYECRKTHSIKSTESSYRKRNLRIPYEFHSLYYERQLSRVVSRDFRCKQTAKVRTLVSPTCTNFESLFQVSVYIAFFSMTSSVFLTYSRWATSAFPGRNGCLIG